MLHEKKFTYHVFSHENELAAHDLILLNKAREMTTNSYAPYSKFKVGAAALLSNGEIITGCNYENASIGGTICAERVLLGALQASINHKEAIKDLAISYDDGQSNYPITPCGICRQLLLEHETNTQSPIRLIMGGMSGEVWIMEGIHNILPLGYTKTDLLK